MIYLLRVRGDSMLPTLRPGGFVLALSTRLLQVAPGSVVVFRRRDELLIKRALTREDAGWFVVGDQPSRSTDSRRFGAVPREDIRAVAVCSWWPIRWLYRI